MSKQDKIICLDKEFNNEEQRREYFRNELRAKLPELKKIEGFPIGEDEDIINLSDPPYYTACPNPWLNDFIAEWEKEKANIPGRKKDFHVEEPYASDVSEGKNNSIYTAHTYHTKVPHTAVLKYLLYYTDPGDIILDGFAGTGMTGIACQVAEQPDPGLRYKLEYDFKENHGVLPSWGYRKAICGDLSPAATIISKNFNSQVDFENTEKEVIKIIDEIKRECEWMYQTKHSNGQLCMINYVLWSEILVCSNCSSQIVFWEQAVDKETGQVNEEFHCKTCNSLTSKKNCEKYFETKIDVNTSTAYREIMFVPVVIIYEYNGKSYKKKPDDFDFEILKKSNELKIPYWYPTDEIPKGDKTNEPLRFGLNTVDKFYTRRNLYCLSKFRSIAKDNAVLDFIFTSMVMRSTVLNRLVVNYFFNGGGGANGAHLKGTLYVPSLPTETPVINQIENKFRAYLNAFLSLKRLSGVVINTTGSASTFLLQDNSVDYIFTDPPFGSNIMYSELNYLWESWLRVKTNSKDEAIENRTQNKSTLDYQEIMTRCFSEYYRVLKFDKWMTVEFSNTSASVWNSIQTALQRAGFIIANVSALDKKQGSFNAVMNPTSVKQDLVISCYKPSKEIDSKNLSDHGDVAIWEFVNEHLHHLPTHIKKNNSTTAIVERSPKILYDRLITFYLMRGLPVPIDAKDFQDGLRQRFVERDGMYFTAEQAAEYDEKKAKAPQFVQLSLIVTNESDAIEWLKDRLRKQAQKYQDIMPDFRIATQSLRKGDTLPELQDILNENFIQEPDGRWRTPDPNEAKDREALRTKVLLKEFNGYVTAINQPRAKKLKEVRVEALRAGFKNCWEQKDFKTIVTLGDMIPQNILLEDEQLLMYYDIAKDRV